MELELDLLNIPPSCIRDIILDNFNNNTLHKLLPKIFTEHNYPLPVRNKYLPYHAPTLANYYFIHRLFELVCIFIYKDKRYNNMASTYKPDGISEATDDFSFNKKHPLPQVYSIARRDIEQVNYFICAVAWLTADNFRWYNKHPEITEDLSYGLILQYYDFVLPVSCLIADYKRDLFYKLFEDNLSYLKKRAYNDVLELAPNAIDRHLLKLN